MPRYEAGALRAWAAEALRLGGAPPHIAGTVARHLLDADLCGHASHGLNLLPVYLEAVREGALAPAAEPELAEERPAHLVVDGGHGFGQYAAEWTLECAMARARAAGACVASIRRCGHLGRLAPYVERAARASLAAILCAGTVADPSGAFVVPHGGRERRLDTNPIACGIPADPPFVLDMATGATTYYGIVEAAREGRALQIGIAVDAVGRPCTRPADVLHGGAILPFGGHKGYGLGLMAGLLAGLAGPGDDAGVGGVLLVVIDPGGGREPATRALDAVRASRPAGDGSPVLVPGDRARTRRREAEAAGVDLSDTLVIETARRLRELAADLPALPDPLP